MATVCAGKEEDHHRLEFLIFLLSDFIKFSGFYAACAVLSNRIAGGPSAHQLLHMKTVVIETGALLM